MNKVTIKKIIGIVLNLFLFVSSIIIMILGVVYGLDSFKGVFLGHPNPYYLRYFTTLSNIYTGLVGLFIAILLIKNFKKDVIYPKWIKLLYLSAATSVSLTFLTVLFFLAPTFAVNGNNFFLMFINDMFFFHFFNPVVATASYLFFFKGVKLNFKDCFFAMIPMAIYAIIYSSCILTNTWDDFYGFTFGGNNYLIFLVLPIMLVVTYFIGFFINLIDNKCINK